MQTEVVRRNRISEYNGSRWAEFRSKRESGLLSKDTHAFTQVLIGLKAGDGSAADRLLPIVYDELRGIASKWFARPTPGMTLQPTALVHEAFLHLVDQTQVDWKNRSHFFAVA